ncbi:MAG: hypothetical protein FWG22_05165 [Prolixibacteraceae bacterium]|nr:hypothetical protein [Prolixibacteraceae bacterium]
MKKSCFFAVFLIEGGLEIRGMCVLKNISTKANKDEKKSSPKGLHLALSVMSEAFSMKNDE